MTYREPNRPHHRRKWTPDDDAALVLLCQEGKLLREISALTGRTQEACRSRANVLGVPCRSSDGRTAEQAPATR